MKVRLLLALVALWPACAIAQTPDSPSVRQARWEEDIDALVHVFSQSGSTRDEMGFSISKGQLDFQKLYPQKQFKAEIAALKHGAGTRSDAETVLDLMHIVASAHVTHTTVVTPMTMGFDDALPVQFRWFSDGMIVWLANPEYKQTIGLRVLKIGSMTPEKLEEAIAPFVSCENQQCTRWRASSLMPLRPVLGAMHLIDPDGGITLTLDRPGETPLELRLPIIEHPNPWIGVFEALRVPLTLSFKQRDRNYWYSYLDASETVYINYSKCTEDPKHPFTEFVRSMKADLDAKTIRRVIIDLRRNGGGDTTVIHPLLHALTEHPLRKSKIYVLIGPQTYSAAIVNALRLKLDLHATLVGEPTGGKPGNFYGDVRFLTLPNSKLVISYSTNYVEADPGMNLPALVPEIAASMNRADLLAGRDPAINAAIMAGTLH